MELNIVEIAKRLCDDLDMSINIYEVALRLELYRSVNNLTLKELDNMCWEDSDYMFDEIM